MCAINGLPIGLGNDFTVGHRKEQVIQSQQKSRPFKSIQPRGPFSACRSVLTRNENRNDIHLEIVSWTFDTMKSNNKIPFRSSSCFSSIVVGRADAEPAEERRIRYTADTLSDKQINTLLIRLSHFPHSAPGRDRCKTGFSLNLITNK